MRKLFSIVFIVLLLMNVMGYYGVFMGLAIRNDAAMVQRLDQNNFRNDQLVTLKIPVSMPYATDYDYQRVDGKIEHNGEVYRLLKQKLSKDTLSIVCVRDFGAKKINIALMAYLKTFSDNHASQQSPGKLVLSLIKDYIPQVFELCSQASLWEQEVLQYSFAKILIPSYCAHVVHPPERA